MPRILRTELPNGYFHVTARGVDGTRIVRDDADGARYLELLAATVARYDWNVIAFCLMPNHVHVLLEATQVALSRGIQWLHGVYGLRFNRRHGRKGHLFGARFASWVVLDDEHFDAAGAYILDNPVRAGLCRRAEDWPWSGLAPLLRNLDEHMFGR